MTLIAEILMAVGILLFIAILIYYRIIYTNKKQA